MAHIIQTSAILLAGLLLRNRFLFPISHTLGPDRGWSVIKPWHRTLSHGRWRTRGGAVRASLSRHIGMVRVQGRGSLMLGICRLGRRNTVVMNGTAIRARAVGMSERSDTVGRVRAIAIVRGRSRRRWSSSAPVGVSNTSLRDGCRRLRLLWWGRRLRVLMAQGRGRTPACRPRSSRVVVGLTHLLIRRRTRLAPQGRSSSKLSTRLIGVGRLRWWVDVGEAASPVFSCTLRRWRGARCGRRLS